jgi:carbamoyl-phosphate synthase large subunit
LRKKANILVTGVGGIVGQGIIKCLKMVNADERSSVWYGIIGANASPFAAGLYMVKKGVIIPKADDDKYIASLIDIIKRNKVSAVYVGTDPELAIISKNRKFIEEETSAKVLVNPLNVIDIARDKWKTFRFLEENGFPCAESAIPEYLTSFLNRHKFPLVVKPREAYGSLQFHLVNDRHELDYAISNIEKCGWRPIIQEYLAGEDNEYTTGVLIDTEHSRVISSVSIQKYLKFGQTYKALIDDFIEIRKLSEKISLTLGASGAVNIQSKLSGGINKVFEINPRFSATCPMRAVAGINEPDLLYRNAVLGQEIKLNSYKKLVCMRYWNEVYVEKQKYEEIVRTGIISRSRYSDK